METTVFNFQRTSLYCIQTYRRFMEDVVAIASIVAGFGSLIVAAILTASYAQQSKTYRLQLEAEEKQNEIDRRQEMLDSARLVMDLDEYFKTDTAGKLIEAVMGRKLGDELLSEEYFLKFHECISHLSLICKFYQDGLITPIHMRNFFYSTLMAFDDNDWVHDYLDKHRGKYLFLYIGLQEIRKEFPRHTDPFEQQKTLFDQTTRNDYNI